MTLTNDVPLNRVVANLMSADLSYICTDETQALVFYRPLTISQLFDSCIEATLLMRFQFQGINHV